MKKKLLTISEVSQHIGGLNKKYTKIWCKQIGAKRRCGLKTMYDISVIDAVLKETGNVISIIM